jgi:hypothetical protein
LAQSLICRLSVLVVGAKFDLSWAIAGGAKDPRVKSNAMRAPSDSSRHSPNERIQLEISKVVSIYPADESCSYLGSCALDRCRSGVILQGMNTQT